MQEAIHTSGVRVERQAVVARLTISAEVVVYLALFALAVVLRVAELDTVPMMPAEVPQALAAWRAVSPLASGDPVIPQSALLFALQSISFTVLGGTEIAARFLTALGGAALVVSPALFRGGLGPGRALILSLFLLCSPVLLAASRFSSPVVWSLLFAVVGLWALWCWSQTRQSAYGVLAVVLGMALVFLTEPGGPVLALILALAAVIARAMSRSEDAFDFEAETEATSDAAQFPWQRGIAIGALVVIAVATGFMLYPAGLSAVGETLAGALRGFTEVGETPLLPFVVSIFYEPFLWTLAIIAVVVFVRRGDLSVIDRFLAAWVFLGGVASLLFVGGTAGHALWTTVPLTVLVSRLVIEMLSIDRRPSDWSAPYWARGVIALVTLALLAIFTMALQSMARAIVESLDGTFAGVNVQLTSLILIIIPVMFLVVVYFTAVSLWNGRVALRGIGLGLAAFALITSLGSGWEASVVNADDPLEPFHLRATSADVFLLRSTLFDVANRLNEGFSTLPVTVVAEPTSVMAWVVRDFRNARFISDANEARGDEVVISSSETFPDLGSSYVGQDFMAGRDWQLPSLTPVDLLAWWTQGRVGATASSSIQIRTAFLWLRQDVYNGLPVEP